MDTPQAQPGAASAPVPDANVVALDSYRAANSAALSNPKHAEHGKALAQYRELAGKAFPDNAPEAANKSAAQAAPSSGGAPADAINAVEAFKRENASALFGPNPDHGKRAELARLNSIAFPDVPDVPGQIIYQPAEDGLTSAANAAVADVPADPAGYKFDHTTMAPGTHDKALDAEYRTLAHADLKLPQATAAYIFAKHNELMAHPETALSEAASTEKLRAIWGSQYDEKMQRVGEVLRAIPKAKHDWVVRMFSVRGLGNDVGMLSQLAFLGEMRAAAKGKG